MPDDPVAVKNRSHDKPRDFPQGLKQLANQVSLSVGTPIRRCDGDGKLQAFAVSQRPLMTAIAASTNPTEL
jgi:hypothetical protein